jgi:FMN phosphatase YigB (HAD superfamily)
MTKKESILLVFDLFGTLVQTPNPLEVKQLLDEIDINCEGPGDLYKRWVETSELRDKGYFRDSNSYWEYVGVGDTSKATLLYSRTNDYWLSKIRPGAVDYLRDLSVLYKNLTLCSNAGFETQTLLRNSELHRHFKKIIISADVKSMKPDDNMYKYSIPEEMNPEYKFFIGDGGSQELEGALRNNFIPIQIAELKHDGSSVYRTLGNEFIKIESLDLIEKTIENQIKLL